MISQLGYKLIYEPRCVVYNKGPLTVRDFLKQRRRIYAGHLLIRSPEQYEGRSLMLPKREQGSKICVLRNYHSTLVRRALEDCLIICASHLVLAHVDCVMA